MNVRDWPMNRILQLRDECFGQRWPISEYVAPADANAVFVISDMALPEHSMIWEVHIQCGVAFGTSAFVGIRIGDVLPTTDAQFYVLEPLLPGVVGAGEVRSQFVVNCFTPTRINRIRQMVHTAGRRLVFRFIRDQGTALIVQVTVVISSVPTEVPDCLLSV